MNWKFETRKLSEIKPWGKNPRRITMKGLKDLTASINKFGLPEPIVLNADGTIIGGHARFQALKSKDVHEAFCAIPEKPLTEKQLEELNIRLNKNIAGEFDFDVLANEFEVEDLLDWGFTEDELNISEESSGIDAPARIDRAEELEKKWGTKNGQIWKLGDHKIICGDSGSPEIVQKLMGDLKATLLFTDPPYGVSIGKKNELLNKNGRGGRSVGDLEMDELKPEELRVSLTAIFKNWVPVMADDCSVFVCSAQGGELGRMMMMAESGLEVRHIIIWVKNYATFSMGRLDYDYQHEPILFTWKKTHKRKKEGPFQTSIWNIDKPMANKNHPTIKPVELPENAILNHTDQADVVVDMFLGSGTTLIAAERTGRVFRGCEISPKYIAVVLDRWAEATGKKPELIEG